ncbi:MAG: hypothetical protein MUC35_04585 [Candidatus Margulisbacteria bacterium]|jgi:hypothetical protein|nr:hypothetical protein [Candidatus Margulisiibacteriota bacterium]
MKRLIIGSLLAVLLLTVAAHAARSKDFFFSAALLQSLYQYEKGRELIASFDDAKGLEYQVKLLNKGMAEWRQGREIIKPYLEAVDPNYQSIATTVDNGLDLFLDHGEKTVYALERTIRGEMLSEEEMQAQGGDQEDAEDQAYTAIGNAVAGYAPTGLSKQERGILLFRIDLLFGRSLRQYRQDQTKVNEIVAGIAKFEKSLKER